MSVSPGGSAEEPVGVDVLLGAAKVFPHCGDPPVGDRHVPGESGFPGPVDNLSAANQYVMHEISYFHRYVSDSLVVLYHKPFHIVTVNHNRKRPCSKMRIFIVPSGATLR